MCIKKTKDGIDLEDCLGKVNKLLDKIYKSIKWISQWNLAKNKPVIKKPLQKLKIHLNWFKRSYSKANHCLKHSLTIIKNKSKTKSILKYLNLF